MTDESEYAETTSFKFADRKLEALLERLKRQNVARHHEQIGRGASDLEAIETLEELLGELRTGALPRAPFSLPTCSNRSEVER